MSPSSRSRKRAKAKSPISRAKKKHKRLDAIDDKPLPAPPLPDNPSSDSDDHRDRLRRSSRSRRPPDVLDSSPVACYRRKPDPINKQPAIVERKKEEKKKSVSVSVSISFEEENEDWRSRLRARVRGGRRKGIVEDSVRVLRNMRVGKRRGIDMQDRDLMLDDMDEEAEAEAAAADSKEVEDELDEEEDDPLKELEGSGRDGEAREEGGDKEDIEETNDSDLKEREKESPGQEVEDREVCGNDECEKDIEINHEMEMEKVGAGEQVLVKNKENINGNSITSEKSVKESDMASPMSDNKLSSARVKEGRRCGLCGGGVDGKPPKKLIRESVDSDNEAYEGSSASEEPNYDVWDGFGDEPGWLGKLLGPIHDRFGIARVWVHQHCAVWSPEVYFAGLGCLKNVRAALCRGRALKCSRCGRPGATIGCRVDRCPKTYHLPCSRAEGCIFDHRKFLIACNDHRRLFQPQGISYYHQIRKRKAKKLKLELKKLSNDALRKDLEAEEKWLEHWGEDEEFLKREGKRLHRDILRIAPTYIGGPSENENLYQGWESVAGLQGVIQCLKEVVILPLLYPDLFSNLGLTPPRGILLHGYPGTGKTLVVRALIGACSRGDKRIAYFARKGADCLGKYVGDAERQLRLLFQVAEKSQPSIIFFDEIDGLAPVRSRNQDQTHSSVVSTLLSLMDGLKSRGSVIVIGATNRPESIDPALRRPGRFDREIYFPLPSEKDRSAILSLHTRSWPNPLSGKMLSWVSNQTVGYAGADLQALCAQAAMSALKQNFALKELLSSAEKGFVQGRLPSLPSIVVKERDWIEALAQAAPPCSRREAGIAANDVVSSPLPAHLTPCLLKPLLLLLISIHNDERIWLPPALSKSSKSIKSIIVSSLEEKQLPVASWRSHLHLLIKEKSTLKEIEANLCRYGLISIPSTHGVPFVSDDDNDEQKSNSSTARPFDLDTRKPVRMFSLKLERLTGFRSLISGSPKSGQQHLASCLLHGFMGHIEIKKVNLATISLEGHGDLLRGLTQILSTCLNLERCIIYLPRIDLWAINDILREDVEESQTTATSCNSSITNPGATNVSDIWNSFVEQVDSVNKSTSLIILATCEIESHDLPMGIKQFFTGNILHANSAMSEHTIPRFIVHIDGSFDNEMVINSSADKLADNLIQNFVQLLHHKTHPISYQHKTEVANSLEANAEAQRQGTANGQQTGLVGKTVYSDEVTFNSRASLINDEKQLGVNYNPSSLISGQEDAGINSSSHHYSFPKILPCKAAMGSSTLAIVTFGYQILRCPQFAELCWVTSKLREGPCTDINGPWKGWPFNSCVMHDSNLPSKVSAGGNSSLHNERDSPGVVRGLPAVGLLSYRGVYSSVREVAIEVRKVLELLVGQIHAKILARKDRNRYLRILSQVAYLEDMVNSWAFKLQSSHINNPSAESNTKISSQGIASAENNLCCANDRGIQPHVPCYLRKNCVETQEAVLTRGSSKSFTSNGQCADFNSGLSNHSSLVSGMSIIPETKHLQADVPSAPLPLRIPPSPITSVGEDESCRKEGPELAKQVETNSDMTESILVRGNLNSSGNAADSSARNLQSCSNGVGTILSSHDTKLVAEEPYEMADPALQRGSSNFPASKVSCLYKCCPRCFQALNVLIHDILSECWESKGGSTVDDINYIVSWCSLNLLAAFRKCDLSESNNNLAGCDDRIESEHCDCQEIGDKKLKQMSYQSKTSKNRFLAADCSCHLRNEENATVPTESDSALQQTLTYFVRDGVLVSSEPRKDDDLHCKYDTLCLCSMLELILAIRKHLC